MCRSEFADVQLGNNVSYKNPGRKPVGNEVAWRTAAICDALVVPFALCSQAQCSLPLSLSLSLCCCNDLIPSWGSMELSLLYHFITPAKFFLNRCASGKYQDSAVNTSSLSEAGDATEEQADKSAPTWIERGRKACLQDGDSLMSCLLIHSFAQAPMKIWRLLRKGCYIHFDVRLPARLFSLRAVGESEWMDFGVS